MTTECNHDLQSLRQLAIEYLNVATDGEAGRSEQSPIYKLITENRDFGKGYSSCGDLCHWLLYRLGVRAHWLNRQEHRGWATGANISRLMWKAPASAPRPGETFEAGDILAIWNREDGTDAHVMVVRAHGGEYVYSSDYGQPGGARRVRSLKNGILGDRRLQRVLRLSDVLEEARRESTLEPAQRVSEWLTGANAGASGDGEPTTLQRPTLQRGMISDHVRVAQNRLGGLTPDGNFGPKTEARVREFQRVNGLVVDGVIGRKTWGLLL